MFTIEVFVFDAWKTKLAPEAKVKVLPEVILRIKAVTVPLAIVTVVPVPAKVTVQPPVLVIVPKSWAAPALNAIVPLVKVRVVLVNVAPKPLVLAVRRVPPFIRKVPAPEITFVPAIRIPLVLTLRVVPLERAKLLLRVIPAVLAMLIVVILVVVAGSSELGL